MDGFERRRQGKRDAIMNSAQELFMQYGFNKVSIADIARKASVSQVSIYNFFESKENLKRQLLKKLWENYYTAMISIIKNDGSIQNKIERLLFTVADYSRNYTANFMTESVRLQLENGEDASATQLADLDATVFSLLEQGKKVGVIRDSISTNAMVNFIEMFKYHIMHSPEAVAKYDMNPELLREMVSLFLAALFN